MDTAGYLQAVELCRAVVDAHDSPDGGGTAAGSFLGQLRTLLAPAPAGLPCESCGREFDPIATRWLCPWCKHKANCCNGAPLPPVH